VPQGSEGTAATSLLAYVPRLAIDWLAGTPTAAHHRAKGTLLFVDVSGFTELTERLASRGKVGAEEITEVIGKVFGDLLGVAATYGGDLLKWGGDAVLLYFADPGSATRALRTAWLMVEAMDRVGRLRTSSGRINLQISVGVHSGEFDLYLLGDRHRELIITGPGASKTAEMEALAEAGEIVVSPETAIRLDKSVLGEPKHEGVVLRAPPDAEPAPRVTAAPAQVDIASLIPADTRERLHGTDEAEHRQVTVAFIEFSGIDALTDAGGGDLVARHLDPVVSAAEAAAERFGVNFHETDIGRDGGKIVLVGGFPMQHGDDAERLIRATYEVVTRHPADSPVRLRAGITSGRAFVFSYDFRHAGRRVVAVMGDTVNLAARVMGQAAPGQVLATVTALERANGRFEVTPLDPFRVKGKAEPQRAAVVGTPLSVDSEQSEDRSLFVGRDAELEELLAHARSATLGSGTAVNLVGPAGIGKSRLVSEVIARSGLVSLRVACEEYSRSPYRPFRHIFRRLLDVADDAPDDVATEQLRRAVRALAPDLEPYLPVLADVVDVRVPPTPETVDVEARFRGPLLERTILRLLRASVTTPSALVVEDAHVIDEASASLLASIAGEATTLPLLVLLTSRPQAVPFEALTAVRTMELAPIGTDAAGRLAREDGNLTPLSAAEIDAIVERAGGNPLFLNQLLHATRDAGGFEELPENLEPLLAADIDRLPAHDRQVLRTLSVLGTNVDAVLVNAVLGTDVDAATWANLSRFLTPTASGLRFAHDLLRVTAYEGLPFRRRREVHAQAASALEAFGEPERVADQLSLHWLRAEAWDKTWHYARVAGDRARALWANADAATFYGRAVEAARRVTLPRGEVLAVAEALGDMCDLAGAYLRAKEAYVRARRLAVDDVDQARLTRKLGMLQEHQGRYPAALASYTRARGRLPDDVGLIDLRSDIATERAEIDIATAGVLLRSGRFRRAIAFAAAAERQLQGASQTNQLARALLLQHLSLVYVGENNQEIAHRALGLYESVGNIVGAGSVLNNLGIAAQARGDWPTSNAYYERSRVLRQRSGDVVGAATQENNLGENLINQGRLEEAHALLESAHRGWAAAGYTLGVAVTRGNLGLLLCRACRGEEGRPLLLSALEEFRRLHSPYAVMTELRLAECDIVAGNFLAAREAITVVRRHLGKDDASARLTALRIEVTASALASLAGLADPGLEWERNLGTVVEKARTMDEPFDLAMALGTRAVLVGLSIDRRGGPSSADGQTMEAAASDQQEAAALFARLGVLWAVITWSERAAGRPLLATGSLAVAQRAWRPNL
jgi:class 3 adenylate cyclase/predicted ATPase